MADLLFCASIQLTDANDSWECTGKAERRFRTRVSSVWVDLTRLGSACWPRRVLSRSWATVKRRGKCDEPRFRSIFRWIITDTDAKVTYTRTVRDAESAA